MRTGWTVRLVRACALAAIAGAAPVSAHADDACRQESSSSTAAAPPVRWSPPLDRPLGFHARELSLRDALDRLAATARIRISYSAELLPLQRRVCVGREARTVGDALADLLRGTRLEAVVAGDDHVVIALRRASAAAEEPREFSRVVPLERVVVTGSAGEGPQRALPFALDVITGEQLERQGTAPLTRILATAAPGPWGWEQSPGGLMARFGSIRGASSFGVSAPKVFIDGIEVANPLLVTQIAPEAVERVEVIRGPQGAALYGTDAISGVVNIVTRHEGTDAGASPLRVRAGLGRAESEFAAGSGALAQELAVALRAGTSVRSGGVDVGVGGMGEFLPDGASRYLLVSGNARQVGARSIATGILRFYDARAGSAVNPLLSGSLGRRADSLRAAVQRGDQRVRQYTVGGTVRLAPDARWTHTLTTGIDGDRLVGVPDERTPVPFLAEGVWRGTTGGADRGSVRLSSVGRFGEGGETDLTLTLAAEHSVLREQVNPPDPGERAGQTPQPGAGLTTWTQSTGVVAQATASLRDRLHLTGGVRLERNEGLADPGYAALPVLGGVWVAETGGVSLKVRAAYGSGSRPQRGPARDQAWGGSRFGERRPELSPERQSGLEAGVDLAFGQAVSLQLTAYDQLASGLIQRVPLPRDTAGGRPRTPYEPQTVGQISNRGWEMQGTARLGRLSLEGAAAGVDSRVRRLQAGYGGDLRMGDRMLEVPAYTLSGTAAWAEGRWGASLTGYRAFDWINYDRLALARDFQARGGSTYRMTGIRLRDYWRRYDGVTRLNATATLALPRGTTLVLTGQNLLNRQQGEPDNLTVVPGRTLMLGLRASF